MQADAIAEATVKIEDVEYITYGGVPLVAKVYQPTTPGPHPLLVEIHGGAWCRGSRTDEHNLNLALAKEGIAVAAIDFRMPPVGVYPASMVDINFAIRWVKTLAADWNVRSEWIGVMGVSSGAHQAILTAMRPRDPRYSALHLDDADDLSADVRYAVLCWPVIDPLGRYHYAKSLKASGEPYPDIIDRVIPDHEKYWVNEANMAEGNPALALERGEDVAMPAVLYVQGDADMAHPRAHLDRFVMAYRERGGDVTLKIYGGEAESFITKRPDALTTQQAIADIVRFVRGQCVLPAN